MISLDLARKMLEAYLAWEGFLYMGATLRNIPWIFAYMTKSHSLYGRILHKDCLLQKAITAKMPSVEFNEKNQLMARNGEFVALQFTFIHHHTENTEAGLEESYYLYVTIPTGRYPIPKEDVVLKERIVFNPELFQNLINTPSEKANRNQKLLDMAREVLAGYLS